MDYRCDSFYSSKDSLMNHNLEVHIFATDFGENLVCYLLYNNGGIPLHFNPSIGAQSNVVYIHSLESPCKKKCKNNGIYHFHVSTFQCLKTSHKTVLNAG